MAVDPGTKYLAVAILEGEELIWYNIKRVRGPKTLPYMRIQVQQYLTKILHDYKPEILAVEEPFYAQAMSSKNLQTLTQEIKTWGRWKGLRVYSYLPKTVKAYFCGDRKTKQSLAEAMVEQYPFLVQYLNIVPEQRYFEDEGYWLRLFDAVALGLMCHRKSIR